MVRDRKYQTTIDEIRRKFNLSVIYQNREIPKFT